MIQTQPADAGQPACTPPQTARPTRSRAPAWGKAGAGAGLLGTQGAAGYLHPVLGAALAATDVAIPLLAAIVVITVILRGSDQTYERLFRLLRWITNRPEPPAPGQANR